MVQKHPLKSLQSCGDFESLTAVHTRTSALPELIELPNATHIHVLHSTGTVMK